MSMMKYSRIVSGNKKPLCLYGFSMLKQYGPNDQPCSTNLEGGVDVAIQN